MNNVKLMNRTDTKFTFHISRLEQVLNLVIDNYRILEVNGKRVSDYKTLYYDTTDLELYYQHHNGKLNRYKVRHRTYVDSNIGYLEVKFKNNKGRTFKERIKKKDVLFDWPEDAQQFLSDKTPYLPNTLIPTLWVNYSRITLVNRVGTERLTIDLDLEFKKDTIEKKMHQMVIAEVKQEKTKDSPFINVMKKLHIRTGSISKYCMAVAYTKPGVKTNQFKAKLLHIQKILNYVSITSC
ncbi:MAG TPA: polyphosphate polymerase domain-containing protein [Bacteroidia bacterium]|nr:polyphosphate polymerase domain-containing protein [Bacteroidia bacterium]